MKKILAIALLALATLASSAQAVQRYSDNTNFGTVGVGKPSTTASSNTYTILSGVVETYKEVPLTSILTGTNGTTALADTAITTGLYVANPTNLTLSAGAIFFPAEADTGVARIRVRVPKNYISGANLILDCHMAVTYAANLSITATAVQYPVGGLTNTTLVSLAPVFLYSNISPTSSVNAPTSIAFPVGVTVVPESVITYNVKKAGALILEITGVRWGFKAAGIIDGL